MPSDFVHLHVHTEFSLLDGQSKINKLVDRARELEQEAIGITDHGVMFGAIDFFRACTKAGVKPIIGIEAYLAPRKMTDRDPKLDKSPYHMLLLAQNMTGYQNLLKMASAAQLDGYYYRPRIDKEFMEAHAEGIIATSGCLAAEIPRMVEKGNDDNARDLIGWYHDVFGAENFYLELQNHEIDQLDVLNEWLFDYRASNHTPVQLLATNDVHYVLESDADAHDILLCIQTSALQNAPNRMRLLPHGSYYLKSADEMRRDFKGAPQDMVEEAFYNSIKIAEMCSVDLNTDGYHLPVFPTPPPHNEASYLQYLCELGMDWRYDGNWRNDAVLTERLDYELSVINTMGFDTYFLIVWDLCEYARHADIWWNVRGSGAGSLVAYSLGITNIDPIQNGLLFERFLNPDRVSMPDIDLDYPDDRRGEMIAYTARKYGEDKVAAIITFGTLGAKASVRDVGRVMDIDLGTINRAAGMIPQEAKQKPIREYVDSNRELFDLYNSDKAIQQVIDTAIELQGMTRHASTHAAGVIVSDRPLVEYLPLHRITGKDPSGGSLKAVTQFPMETAESIGLLKVDFLGLSTLTILRKACDLVGKHQGIHYTMDNIPYRHDDQRITNEDRAKLDEAFAMMGRGETIGVFQVESVGMQQMLRGMRPKRFENIVAGISLYRPGPMEFIPTYNARFHGEEDVEYLHHKLEPILAETYGIITYQEQILQIAAELFGYKRGEADLMRKAVSKKREKDLMKHKALFLERGPDHGVDVETSESIFKDIEFFANYGFNKCLVGSTQILDAQTGMLHTIEELYENQSLIKQTLSLDTDTYHLREEVISAVMLNGVKPIYRLTTKSGRQIDATGNHPFYTFTGWVNLEDLDANEQIAVPRYLPIEGKKELAIDDLISISDSINTKQANKLPKLVFELTNGQNMQIIARIWAKDGAIMAHNNVVTCYYTHESEPLMRQIQHLLLRLGIVSQVAMNQSLVANVGRTYYLRIIKHDVPKFMDEISKVTRDHDLPLLEEDFMIKSDTGRLLYEDDNFEEDVYWDDIASIEPIGEELTYDLSIDTTHNFVANDIIVHNSHASDYAVITVQTAFLKSQYPEEYMTALLTVQRDDSSKVASFLEECRRLNIPVLPPDVNYSMLDFDIEQLDNGQRGIRFGLAAIKNAGVASLEYLIEQREAEGAFESIKDLCQRVDLGKVGKRTLESLIRVGALRGFGERAPLLAGLERLVSYSTKHHKDLAVGQMTMFGDTGFEEEDEILQNLPNVEEVGPRKMLLWEKELLGLYVTGRPIDAYKGIFDYQNLTNVNDLLDPDYPKIGEDVRVGGEIVSMRKIITKNNENMAVLQLEDYHDSAQTIEVVLFPRTWQEVSRDFADVDKELDEGEIVIVRGKLDNRRGDHQIIAESVTTKFEDFRPDDSNGQAYQPTTDEPQWADNEPPPPMTMDELEDMPPAYVDTSLPPKQEEVESPPEWVDEEAEPLDLPEDDLHDSDVPRLVKVFFTRTGDGNRDSRKLKRIHGILIKYPGRDRFTIIVDGGMKQIALEFPDTTQYCPDLVEELQKADIDDLELDTPEELAI